MCFFAPYDSIHMAQTTHNRLSLYGFEILTCGDSCVAHDVDDPSAAVVVMWRKKDADWNAGTTHHAVCTLPQYTMNVLSSAMLVTA